MKKLIILLLFISITILGNYPFSTKSIDEIVKLSKKVDLMIEGKVINIEHIYFNFKKKQQIDESEITDYDSNNIVVYTKLTIQIVENFTNKDDSNIDVWIFGGEYPYNEKIIKFKVRGRGAYPFLDAKDQMIMGLKKNKSKKFISGLDFSSGYHFYNGVNLQIPSSEKMIKDVEDGELLKIKSKIYREKLKNIDNDNYPSYEELDNNYIKAKALEYKIIFNKLNFIKNLKKSLRNNLKTQKLINNIKEIKSNKIYNLGGKND